MGFNFFKAFFQDKDSICEDLLLQVRTGNEAADRLLDTDGYVEESASKDWEEKNAALAKRLSPGTLKSLRRARLYPQLRAETEKFLENTRSLRTRTEQHNLELAKKQVREAQALIGNVEGRQLDTQQMVCIVKEAHNHLVIAGAGTGKTTTVVGKIKYLLKSGKRKPEEILVLSFTNASAAEMSERIRRETGCDIAAMTFHKLGMQLIAKAEGVKPNIAQWSIHAFLKKQLEEQMKNSHYKEKLYHYLLFSRIPAKTEFDFSNEKEYNEFLQINPPLTLCGETVKSYGELEIANYLFRNGITYQYEAPYLTDTRTEEYAQYHPDFYLPEQKIYVEYFGINRAGEVPAWFQGKNGKSASAAYREGMNWKFRTHKKNGTRLIACYAYEKMEGTLLSTLEEHLKEYGVAFSPKSAEELFAQTGKEQGGVFEGLLELFETAIHLLKSNAYTLTHFRELTTEKSQKAFIDLLEPLYAAYEAELEKNHEIDFNDMIHKAAAYLREGTVQNPYSFVIVDEYQDISRARYQLLEALRNSRDYELFCVGDDWQSIYRFAGSDVNFILHFQDYWGKSTVTKIETTYRFTPSLIAVSGSFIMQNPDQLKKQIRGKSSDNRFSLGEICGYTERNALDFMTVRLDELPQKATVFLLGRYSSDIDLFQFDARITCQYNNVTGVVDVTYCPRPDLQMQFLTVHKSKGLQADYVFILNNKNSRMGFPSRVQDDPILELLLDSKEVYPFAEERRLYYVALTRAKVKAFFLVQKGKESVFAQELHLRYARELKQEQFTCPKCGGKLTLKKGPYSEFLGCENFKTFGCKYTRTVRKNEPQAPSGRG